MREHKDTKCFNDEKEYVLMKPMPTASNVYSTKGYRFLYDPVGVADIFD